jgi:hypothetical protein
MITLDQAIVYDTESFPNSWTLHAEPLWSSEQYVWEISEFRDDRQSLIQWFNWLGANQIPMIGYNNDGYDYALIHYLFHNPQCTFADLYAKNDSIISGDFNDRFKHTIWPRDRFAPQIDLMKVNHYDNENRRTSLKDLQVAMRAANVQESTVPFGQPVTREQIETDVIPYGAHDVSETKQFALHCLKALEFRITLVPQFGLDALSWNDTKIGEMMLIDKLGEDICFERVPIIGRDGQPWIDYATGQPKTKKQKRQTVRSFIPVKDIVFPYIQFRHPEFQRVHQFMLQQTLTPSDMSKEAGKEQESPLTIQASVGGLTFAFGSGGVHASVESQRFIATDEWLIRDIDVGGMYPAISNVNKLAPEHLGEPFVQTYAMLPTERAQHAKGTAENKRYKLAGNAAWGKSKSPHSCFYDPKYALTVPVNGQLMICMLVDWLIDVPGIRLIQANTDGISYMVHRDHLPQAQEIERRWQDYTMLTLEEAMYSRMWVKDVSNYVAEFTNGKLKLKGKMWHPDGIDYAKSVSDAEAWHKNFNPVIVPRAAVAAMVHGIPPEIFIAAHTDPYDFMIKCKVNRSDQLLLGGVEQQRVTRYYMARDGQELVKVSPPVAGGVIGQWKRANGVTKAQFDARMVETDGQWCDSVCTKNRSKYTERRTAIQAGWKVAVCNVASDFSFDRLDREWYVSEARKLIVH